MTAIPYHELWIAARGRESDATTAGDPAPDDPGGVGEVPGVPAPGREDPMAPRLAVAAGRRAADSGPGRRGGRGVGHHRPRGSQAVERRGPGRVDRPTGRQPRSPATDRRATERVV